MNAELLIALLCLLAYMAAASTYSYLITGLVFSKETPTEFNFRAVLSGRAILIILAISQVFAAVFWFQGFRMLGQVVMVGSFSYAFMASLYTAVFQAKLAKLRNA